MGGGQHHPVHPLRSGHRQLRGDQAAQAEAEQVGALDVQQVQ
jgi:hypothetical protein